MGEEKSIKIEIPKELNEMLNPNFLPKIQEFSQRIKKEIYPDKKIDGFNVFITLQFQDTTSPLTYEELAQQDKIKIQIQTLLDEEKKHQEKKEKENEKS